MATLYKRSDTAKTPDLNTHKVADDNESGPFTEKKHGVIFNDYEDAIVDVSVSGAITPTVTILYWSKEAAQFVPAVPAQAFVAPGAGESFQFQFKPLGRRVFFQVTGVTGGTVTISVGAFGLNSTL